jgi:hypothetical protein
MSSSTGTSTITSGRSACDARANVKRHEVLRPAGAGEGFDVKLYDADRLNE